MLPDAIEGDGFLFSATVGGEHLPEKFSRAMQAFLCENDRLGLADRIADEPLLALS
jgi:hypothetical protein